MRAHRKAAGEIFDNPILIGTITILVVIVAVYLSYIAENGLPFVPTYNVNVDVQNASELVKNADVRVGGARVGQVLRITPEPATRAYPLPFARLALALQKSLQPLPPDTRYQVRLASVLGGKYVEIIPGTAKTGGLADGGTLYLNQNPRLNHNIPFVDLDTAFSTFGPKTQQGLRHSLGSIGDAVAGRGTQFNDATYSLSRLIGPLDNLLALLASRKTHLSQFIDGAAATTSALAPVAPTFSSLLVDGATTLASLQNASTALGQSIDQLPSTEAVATTVLTNSRPVLSDAAAIVQDLKPAAALLPLSTLRLDEIITSAGPVFRRAPRLAAALQAALGAVDGLARDPATTQTFKVLGGNDLATFGASAFVGLGAILRAVAPAQFACNVAALWVRNLSSDVSEGDATAPWIRFSPIFAPNETFLAAKPAPELHVNPYPLENTSQCQAGNEGYVGKQLIGNPPRTATVVDNTTPPPGVNARAARAGLLGRLP
jgi:virulence factor Mce-like protein